MDQKTLDSVVAGALFHFAAKLTKGETLVLGKEHPSDVLVPRMMEFLIGHGLPCDGAMVEGWEFYSGNIARVTRERIIEMNPRLSVRIENMICSSGVVLASTDRLETLADDIMLLVTQEKWRADQAVPVEHITGEFDGLKWAELFCKVYPAEAQNKDVIHTWFSNAIMAGYDHAVKNYKKPTWQQKLGWRIESLWLKWKSRKAAILPE
jgi:hypothetical protein